MGKEERIKVHELLVFASAGMEKAGAALFAGLFKAVANGGAASIGSFRHLRMNLFGGQSSALGQAGEKPGTVVLEAKARGMQSGRLEIPVQ